MIDGLDIYSGRSCSAWCQLAEAHFDAANNDRGFGTLRFLGGGCLDAPEKLPGGSIKSFGKTVRFVAQSLAQRDDELGWTLKEQQRRSALAERLIAEVSK